jgi:hypothetical protein
MQSTGQASTQAVSLVPMQGSAITYAMTFSPENCRNADPQTLAKVYKKVNFGANGSPPVGPVSLSRFRNRTVESIDWKFTL